MTTRLNVPSNMKQRARFAVKRAANSQSAKPSVPVAACQVTGFDSIFRSITISGDPDFQARVKGDLSRIYSTPTGNKLLLSLRDSGKRVEIKPLNSQEARTVGPYTKPHSRDIYPDWLGRSGKGSDSSISYDPNNTVLGREAWLAPIPTGIVLSHELIHAEHMATGTVARGLTNNDRQANPAYDQLGQWDPRRLITEAYVQEQREEVQTAGIPPDDKGEFTENKIRAEWRPPQMTRPFY